MFSQVPIQLPEIVHTHTNKAVMASCETTLLHSVHDANKNKGAQDIVELSTGQINKVLAQATTWSPAQTTALIDAWSDKHILLKRGNFKLAHWNEIAQELQELCDFPVTGIKCK